LSLFPQCPFLPRSFVFWVPSHHRTSIVAVHPRHAPCQECRPSPSPPVPVFFFCRDVCVLRRPGSLFFIDSLVTFQPCGQRDDFSWTPPLYRSWGVIYPFPISPPHPHISPYFRPFFLPPLWSLFKVPSFPFCVLVISEFFSLFQALPEITSFGRSDSLNNPPPTSPLDLPDVMFRRSSRLIFTLVMSLPINDVLIDRPFTNPPPFGVLCLSGSFNSLLPLLFLIVFVGHPGPTFQVVHERVVPSPHQCITPPPKLSLRSFWTVVPPFDS